MRASMGQENLTAQKAAQLQTAQQPERQSSMCVRPCRLPEVQALTALRRSPPAGQPIYNSICSASMCIQALPTAENNLRSHCSDAGTHYSQVIKAVYSAEASCTTAAAVLSIPRPLAGVYGSIGLAPVHQEALQKHFRVWSAVTGRSTISQVWHILSPCREEGHAMNINSEL